jgi:diaminohydroxyphosphoribosylaminopyrimidine deaminase / 5-amino-6-(5-phosphoribosylamino)uracil reductase
MGLFMNIEFLHKVLELAKTKRGFCAPNPAVGAIVVKNNKILGQGYHHGSGHSHAEVEALKNLNEEAKGATLYVTLEPCCHFGKTPPCTDLIIQYGIKKVIFGFKDPNPKVANKSEKILQQAGIEVMHAPLKEIDEFYHSYAFWWKNKTPFVTAKLAVSLDGKIAGANGARVNITGEAAQLFTHQQRKISDAILTAAKTIIKDDPLLNVRLPDTEYKKPLYILDAQLQVPTNAEIFNSAKSVTLFHAKTVSPEKIYILEKKGARCIAVANNEYGLDLNEILQVIGKDGMHDLWIEAGGHCFSSLLKQKLLQKAFIYVAPKWLGAQAQSAFADNNDLFASAIQKNWRALGEDGLCELFF